MRQLIGLLFILLLFIFPKPTFAQSAPHETYLHGEVVKISQQGKVISDNQTNLYQDLQIKITEGNKNGKAINVHYGDPQALKQDQILKTGDHVVLLESTNNGKTSYFIYDKFRLNNIVWVVLLFVVLVIAVTGLKGIGSLVGLGISLGVIILYIVPQILKGADPLFVSVIGSIVILLVTTYVAHGFSKQTSIALVSTLASLFITVFIAIWATSFSKLTGIGNEDIASLQMGSTSVINLKGLFLAGIIIGTLGALNDVTIGQSATIFELARSEPTIKYWNLFKKSFLIGREHILSLVNTLVLAYAGSALFIFIYLVLNPSKVPYWVILNTETISGEIAATIIGSSGLILAVPIVTALAAWIALRQKN